MAQEPSSPRPQPQPRPQLPPCFTGNLCTTCGSDHMVRSGTCECCQDCGTTSGCS